eukprot:SAG31_NODE_8406_length_1458_cov_0.988962_2_plen_117_part_00
MRRFPRRRHEPPGRAAHLTSPSLLYRYTKKIPDGVDVSPTGAATFTTPVSVHVRVCKDLLHAPDQNLPRMLSRLYFVESASAGAATDGVGAVPDEEYSQLEQMMQLGLTSDPEVRP